MPTFVVRLVHTSDQCPTANSKVRDRVLGGAAEIPKLAQDLGVKSLPARSCSDLNTKASPLSKQTASKRSTISCRGVD